MSSEYGKHISTHLRQVFFGGNWTVSNVKEHIESVTWQQAIVERDGFNSIATLFFHIAYYLQPQIDVLEGRKLEASDKESFRHSEITSSEDWLQAQQAVWRKVEKLASLIENLPDGLFSTDFSDSKYGTYHRNILGLIEHTHYHLGQIVLLKKLQ